MVIFLLQFSFNDFGVSVSAQVKLYTISGVVSLDCPIFQQRADIETSIEKFPVSVKIRANK